MSFTNSIAEVLILTFVALNCYVNVQRFKWDLNKRKERIEK